MTLEEAREICDRITYKPTWAIETRIQDTQLIVRLTFLSPCAVTGKEEIQVCSTHVFADFMLECMDWKAFCNKLLWVFRQAEEHELREFFKLDGVALYDPHK